MAVQQNRKSRSRRDMRRSHDFLTAPALSIDESGEVHLRHHISLKGRYRGKQIIAAKTTSTEAEQE